MTRENLESSIRRRLICAMRVCTDPLRCAVVPQIPYQNDRSRIILRGCDDSSTLESNRLCLSRDLRQYARLLTYPFCMPAYATDWLRALRINAALLT